MTKFGKFLEFFLAKLPNALVTNNLQVSQTITLLSTVPERGVCMPTVLLWLLFLYIEVAVRLREFKSFPFHLDLCRPFAAHW